MNTWISHQITWRYGRTTEAPCPPYRHSSAYSGSGIRGQIRICAGNAAVLVLESDKKSEKAPVTASTLTDKPAVT